MPKRTNTVLRRQSREIIHNVMTYMQKEKAEGAKNLHQALRRVAEATGVSVQTVSRIAKQAKTSDAPYAPGKKRVRPKPVTDISHVHKGIIRRSLLNFHIKKEIPTLQKILTEMRNELDFKGCTNSIRKIVHSLGFRWKKTESNKKILLEKYDIQLKRIEYLQKIKRYREEGRDIVYTGEKYLHAGSREHLIVAAAAGSGAGLVRNSLLLFKLGSRTGEFQHDMNSENYQKWLRSILIPNLSPNSVVVIDTTSYNNEPKDVVPTSTSSKAEMESWLWKKGIPYSKDMLKPQMYKLILLYQHSMVHNTYVVDEIFQEYDHIVLRLPPYHPDLNPMETVWASVKDYVSGKKIDLDTYITMQFIKDKLDIIDKDEWFSIYKNIEQVEDQYRYIDYTMDSMIDELKIHIKEEIESSLESDGESENKSTDSEFENALDPGDTGTEGV